MTLRAHSTYDDLRNRVEQDVARLLDTTQITPSDYISWILRAQELICQRIDVREEYNLHYLNTITDYTLNDRPAITNVSAGTPATVTAVAHGLTVEGSLINLAGVPGITDGRYTAFNLTADTFDLYTADSTLAAKTAVTGVSSYSGGGRFWLATEIPTFIDTLIDGQILTPAFIGTVYIRPIGDINEMMNLGAGPYPLAQWPTYYGMSRAGGRKYVRVWVPPSVDGDLILAGNIKVVPASFMGDTSTTQIILESEFDPIIEQFLKARIHEHARMIKESVAYDQAFFGAIVEKTTQDGPIVRKITYW